jgi:hypothetical protein
MKQKERLYPVNPCAPCGKDFDLKYSSPIRTDGIVSLSNYVIVGSSIYFRG